MSRDALAYFAAAQAGSAMVVGDVASTAVVDTLAAGGIIGRSPKLEVVVKTALLASGGAASLSPVLQDSADNSTYTDLVVLPSTAKATLVAGYKFPVTVIPARHKRYLRLVWRTITNDFTAGTADAYLTDGSESRVAG